MLHASNAKRANHATQHGSPSTKAVPRQGRENQGRIRSRVGVEVVTHTANLRLPNGRQGSPKSRDKIEFQFAVLVSWCSEKKTNHDAVSSLAVGGRVERFARAFMPGVRR